MTEAGEERFLHGNHDDPGQGWREEASAVFSDIQDLVKQVFISQSLPCNESGVYFNLETKEDKKLTVELSTAGFKICGNSFDNIDENEMSPYYETIYALLDNLSPLYRESFSQSLAAKLNALNREEDE